MSKVCKLGKSSKVINDVKVNYAFKKSESLAMLSGLEKSDNAVEFINNFVNNTLKEVANNSKN